MIAERFSQSFLRQYRRAYNQLEDVDDSYATLLGHREHMATVAELLRIIREHGAQAFAGVSLLHRHFSAGPGHVFVERRFTPRAKGHAPVLVTSPVPSSDAPKRVAAHRYAFREDGELQPLEFTTDRAAIRGAASLEEAPDLRKRLAELVASSGLQDRLGVGVFPREASIFDATHVFVEETDFDKVQSIVHVFPSRDRVAGRLIPTLWTAVDGGSGCCSQSCVAYCKHSGGGFGYCGHKKSGHIGCV